MLFCELTIEIDKIIYGEMGKPVGSLEQWCAANCFKEFWKGYQLSIIFIYLLII